MTDEYPQFRTVLRGYDPAQVEEVLDKVFAALEDAVKRGDQAKADVASLTAEHERVRTTLEGDLEQARSRVTQLEQGASDAPVTFETLGTRIGAMLSVADEEASEIRRTATEEARALRDQAQAVALATRTETDHDVERLRAAAEENAAAIAEQARQEAAALRAESEREAAGIRERTQALYAEAETSTEARRAELDRTTTERRQQADAEHTALLAEQDARLRAARAQVDAVESDARERLTRHGEHREQVRARVQEVRTQLTALLGPGAVENTGDIRNTVENDAAAPAARPAPPEPSAQPDAAPQPAAPPDPGDASEPGGAAEPTHAEPAAELPRDETSDTAGDEDSAPAAQKQEAATPYAFGVTPQTRRRNDGAAPDGADESFEGEPWSQDGEEPPRRRWSLSSRQ